MVVSLEVFIVSNEEKKNGRSDNDILRARDLIPSLNRKDPETVDERLEPPSESKQKPKQNSQRLQEQAGLLETEIDALFDGHEADGSAKPPDEQKAVTSVSDNDRAGIPEFNLAEQIMAEQRQLSAVRRKGPGQKSALPVEEPIQPVAEPKPETLLQEQTATQRTASAEKIIAKLVAEDIERLCRRNNRTRSTDFSGG